MKPKRKLLSLLLAICLVAGLMPTAALAADGDKTIMPGTSGISGYDGTNGYDYIYYGNWSAPDNYTTSGPIKWRVLDDQTNTGGTGLFLLSDVLLGSGTRGGVYFDKSSRNSNAWQGSDAQTWCTTFYSDNFSTGEQGAVLGTTKSDEAFTSTYSLPFAESENILNGDKVFFLSAQEAENDEYGFTNDAARIAYYGDSAGVWWLRSPIADYTGFAGAVYFNGYVDNYYVSFDWAARPAFNLDLTSVLFTSAAAGGKIPAAGSGGNQGGEAADAIFEIGDYDGSEWKLTLLDNNRNFAVTEEAASGKPGDTITLNYTGATTGTNEYISVIIADSNGSTLYYGRVAQPDSANGQVEIKIPDSLAAGEYTLNVFSEQYNGDYKTDYASAFAEVALTVEEAAAPGIDTGKAIQLVDSGTAANISGAQADNIYFGTYQQSSDGSGGYNTDPIKWRVLENANGQLFLLSDQNLDVFQYHTEYESVTWETSTMRSWLNGYGAAQNTGSDNGIDYTSDNFINTAFSDGEQGAIVDTTVVNDDNPDYNTEGGENTNDKIFLLSVDEARNSSYFADDNSRKGTNTAYVADGGKIDGNMFGVGAADYWWLRSPGDYGFIAAIVYGYGGVDSRGSSVSSVSRAVRPAFNLDLTSVLFTSAAVGGKSANGMDSGLTAIGDYDGSEWKLTLLDKSRDFSISNAAIEGSTVTFSYSNAKTGENEYISAVIENNGEITHYGRILRLDGATNGASGSASLTIPAGVTLDNDTKLYVFNEQYNGGENDDTKLTDYASQLIEVEPTVDTTAPTLTAGSATRNSETAATVKFTSDEAGSYYYAVVESGATAPNIDMDKEGTDCVAGENTISISDLTDTAAKDIYIVAKDAAGNVSQQLKITIPAYIAPSYGISASPAALNFGSKTVDYTEAPAAQTVTLTNTGNQNVTVNLPTSTNYIITGGDGFTNDTATLTPNGTANFTVQPKTGLGAGDYSETLTISGSNSTSVSVNLSFEVLDTYTLTVNLNGGSGTATSGSYPAGEVISINAGTRSNYRFAGWTSSNDGTFADASSASTTFTMPAADTTITANWQYNGGGGGSSYDYYTITASAGTGGSISPSGSVSVREDTDKTFTITPDSGYHISDVLVDGKSVGAVASYTFEDVQKKHTIEAVFAKDNPDTGVNNPFTDVRPDDWFYEAVMFVYQNGLMEGTGDTVFAPGMTTTRSMLATLLYRLEGEPAVTGGSAFTDVADSAWYADAVSWAAENGIVGGYGGGLFGPEDNITREQLATILYRYAQAKGHDVSVGEDTNILSYTDALEISEYAIPAMQWACGAGIIQGNGGYLNPQGDATRAEIATMLMRFCGYYANTK